MTADIQATTEDESGTNDTRVDGVEVRLLVQAIETLILAISPGTFARFGFAIAMKILDLLLDAFGKDVIMARASAYAGARVSSDEAFRARFGEDP